MYYKALIWVVAVREQRLMHASATEGSWLLIQVPKPWHDEF
jgi:hypothetical protein